MVNRARSHRVAALEAQHARDRHRRDRCTTCGGVPTQICELDPVTGGIVASIPDDGCPACGAPVAYVITLYPLEGEVLSDG